MVASDALFTAEQLADLEAYHAPHYLWAAVGPVFNLVLFGALLWFGISPLHRLAVSTAKSLGPRLARALPFASALLNRLWGGAGAGTALLFASYLFVLLALLYLPLDVYFDYLLEHRYGLSAQRPGAYLVDVLKGAALGLAPTLALTLGVYGLARRTGKWWLLLSLAVGPLLLLSPMLDPYRARVYFTQAPLPEGPLRQSISRLMEKAHIEVAQIWTEQTSATTRRIQAYFAGQGPTRTIVLNDSLLKNLNQREVLAAVAHEAGHLREPRWPARLGSCAALVTFLFLVDRLFRWSAAHGLYRSDAYADIRTLPLILLLFYVATSLGAPISAWLSRRRELAADRYGLTLNPDPEAFVSMLVKAARINLIDPAPPRWVVWLGQSHPPITERIARASLALPSPAPPPSTPPP